MELSPQDARPTAEHAVCSHCPSSIGPTREKPLPSGLRSVTFSVLRELLWQPRFTILVLAALLLARVCLAATVELSEDESYYWLWSRHLATGYYDHPPMVAYWIRFGTTLFGSSPFGVRFAGLLSTSAVSYLCFKTALSLFQDRWIAWDTVLWLNVGLLLNAAAIIMTPDTPLAFFWGLSLFALAKLVETDDGRWWLLFGLAAGSALVSKYTAAFLAPTVLIWMASSAAGRRWFAVPAPYLGAMLTLAAITPMVVWNYDHQWASFSKQAFHAVKDTPANGFASVGEFLGGQAGLATPVIFGFCVVGGILSTRWGFARRDARWLLLAATSVPIFVFFLIHAFQEKIQPNWPAFLYPSAIIAAVAAALELRDRRLTRAWVERLYASAAPVGLLMTFAVLAHLAFGIFPLQPKADPTSRLHGWTDIAQEIEKIRVKRGVSIVLTTNYALTGEIAYQTDRPDDVLQVNERVRYSFAPPVQTTRLEGRAALLVLRQGFVSPDVLKPYFDDVSFVQTIERHSNTRIAAVYDVYLVSGYRGGLFQ